MVKSWVSQLPSAMVMSVPWWFSQVWCPGVFLEPLRCAYDGLVIAEVLGLPDCDDYQVGIRVGAVGAVGLGAYQYDCCLLVELAVPAQPPGQFPGVGPGCPTVCQGRQHCRVLL